MDKRTDSVWIIAAIAAMACACAARSSSVPAIEVRTDDVERFFAVYDATGGRPTSEQLQREYFDRGSEGLHHLARARNVTAARIADAIAATPALYIAARSCLAVLPRVRDQLAHTFDRLLQLYPEAQRPAVTILVSRGRPLAMAGPGHGVQVGLEGMCSETAAKLLGPRPDDRFVRVIAHEYIHAQQAQSLLDNARPTVLERSLIEGVAEFVGEQIAGGVSLVAIAAATTNREKDIEQGFAADVDKTDLRDWVDNTTNDNPGQLGYWVGYRIAKAFYQRASDKRIAIRQMIEMTDARAFLAASGWHPGIALQE